MKTVERPQSLTMNPKKEICIPSFFIPTHTPQSKEYFMQMREEKKSCVKQTL